MQYDKDTYSFAILLAPMEKSPLDPKNEQVNKGRREFLKKTGVAIGTAAAVSMGIKFAQDNAAEYRTEVKEESRHAKATVVSVEEKFSGDGMYVPMSRRVEMTVSIHDELSKLDPSLKQEALDITDEEYDRLKVGDTVNIVYRLEADDRRHNVHLQEEGGNRTY